MLQKKFSFIFFLILILPYACWAGIDLEEKTQDFVLETKRIIIPEYPNAFNASIVRWKNKLLMSFRHIPNRSSKFDSEIGLVWLDKNFNPISKPQLLDTRGPLASIPSRAEDARLIVINNALYMVYSNNVEQKITKGGFRVFIAQIEYDGDTFVATHKECLDVFEGETKQKREKNWAPFEYSGKLLLAYSLLPHRIFYPQQGACKTIALSKGAINWPYGELKGGTPALKVGNQYLAFFHSYIPLSTIHSDEKSILHYFMGAYAFGLEPPFKITHISQEPIIGKGFYKGAVYTPYWHPLRVVFPCGFIFDESHIWVSYGRQDHEMWIVKLDRKKLIESLIPISN
jgi:predicted GH43/DUF377 family glycosyl hydrolase